MKDEAQIEAFKAIHDVAVSLLRHSNSEEITRGLELIISLARYQHDVRTEEERSKYQDYNEK